MSLFVVKICHTMWMKDFSVLFFFQGTEKSNLPVVGSGVSVVLWVVGLVGDSVEGFVNGSVVVGSAVGSVGICSERIDEWTWNSYSVSHIITYP